MNQFVLVNNFTTVDDAIARCIKTGDCDIVNCRQYVP